MCLCPCNHRHLLPRIPLARLQELDFFILQHRITFTSTPGTRYHRGQTCCDHAATAAYSSEQPLRAADATLARHLEYANVGGCRGVLLIPQANSHNIVHWAAFKEAFRTRGFAAIWNPTQQLDLGVANLLIETCELPALLRVSHKQRLLFTDSDVI